MARAAQAFLSLWGPPLDAARLKPPSAFLLGQAIYTTERDPIPTVTCHSASRSSRGVSHAGLPLGAAATRSADRAPGAEEQPQQGAHRVLGALAHASAAEAYAEGGDWRSLGARAGGSAAKLLLDILYVPREAVQAAPPSWTMRIRWRPPRGPADAVPGPGAYGMVQLPHLALLMARTAHFGFESSDSVRRTNPQLYGDYAGIGSGVMEQEAAQQYKARAAGAGEGGAAGAAGGSPGRSSSSSSRLERPRTSPAAFLPIARALVG